MSQPAVFAPLRYHDGYLPLEDHGLVGDGTTAALVARDGGVTWLCLPRFDSPAVFCEILDARRGGAFRLAPEGLLTSRQYYEADSAVLVTEFRTAGGVLRLRDALALMPQADLHTERLASLGCLVRSSRVLSGRVKLRLSLTPRGRVQVNPAGRGLDLRIDTHPGLALRLNATAPLRALHGSFTLEEGEGMDVLLSWNPVGAAGARGLPQGPRGAAGQAQGRVERPGDSLLDATAAVWRRWMGSFHYAGPEEPSVRRSAITLKLLDHFTNGAILAAPTSSLPEMIGGTRNWDYRYSWIRDAAFGVYALRRIGMEFEAERFLSWVLDAVEQARRPTVLYDIDGLIPAGERADGELEGYRKSGPVRWGNAAVEQTQHDVYGEILDCAYQWATRGGQIHTKLWSRLRPLIRAAAGAWPTPDHGIWEVRTAGRPFTYSAALCLVALDRGARLAVRLGLPGQPRAWTAEAEKIRQAILSEAWDDRQQSITEHLGGGGLDASLLSLPLRRVIEPDHPQMIATTQAVRSRLAAGGGLLYRYLPDESPDGLPGHEGAFLLCSFWLVDNLAYQGRLDEAFDLYRSLCRRGGHLGLLPEQIDPRTGEFLGNYPQGFSHVGLIASGVKLGRVSEARGSG